MSVLAGGGFGLLAEFRPDPAISHDDGPLPRHHRAHSFGWPRSQLREAKFASNSLPSKQSPLHFTNDAFRCTAEPLESINLAVSTFKGAVGSSYKAPCSSFAEKNSIHCVTLVFK